MPFIDKVLTGRIGIISESMETIFDPDDPSLSLALVSLSLYICAGDAIGMATCYNLMCLHMKVW